MREWEPHQICGVMVVTTLCVIFLAFMTAVIFKYVKTPPKKEVPKTVLQQSIDACIYRNSGVAYVPILEKVNNEERLVRCDRKDK